jgi:hypothetical protein
MNDMDREDVRVKKPLVSLLSRMHAHDASVGDSALGAGWWDAIHNKGVDVTWGELIESLEKAFDRKISMYRTEATKSKALQEQLSRFVLFFVCVLNTGQMKQFYKSMHCHGL